MKQQYEGLRRESPDEARQAILALNRPTGSGAAPSSGSDRSKRDLRQFVTVVTKYCRQRKISMGHSSMDLGQKHFVKQWMDRGRSEQIAKEKWTQATSPAMIASGRAFYVGKKLHVWQNQPRVLQNEDILMSETGKAPEENLMDSSSANAFLRQRGGVQLASGANNLFGPIPTLTCDR